MIRWLCCIFILLLAGSAGSATYHVSKAGNDSNDGLDWGGSNAWLTLTNVNDTTEFKSGDTVIFGAGIWREELYMMSGTGDDKTCYMDSAWSAGTEDSRVAWIYGSDALDTWDSVTGDIWRCGYTPGVMNNEVGVWQGDSILLRQTSTSLSEGQSYYTNDSVYAHVYGDGDPDLHQMEIGQRACVNMCRDDGSALVPSQDNVTLIGLGFKYSLGHQLQNCGTGRWELGWDSTIISHCYFGNNSGWGGDNPALIYAGRAGVPEDNNTDPRDSSWLDGYDNNRITACSLGQNYALMTTGHALPQIVESYNGAAIQLYGLRYSVIDSNIFWGTTGRYGAIWLKSVHDADSGGVEFDTIRFNTFDCASNAIIQVLSGSHHLVIYGNTFHNTQTGGKGIYMRHSALGVSNAGFFEIYNNTFYNMPVPMQHFPDDEFEFPYQENKFKYNIIYQTSATDVVELDSTVFWIDVDSNMYYTESGTNGWESDNATPYTFTQWQGIGFDSNSTDVVDPGFTDALNGDYSRPGASGEMSRDYDGWLATIFGATQNEVVDSTRAKMDGDSKLDGDAKLGDD